MIQNPNGYVSVENGHTKEERKLEFMGNPSFKSPGGTPAAVVSVEMGATINLGNYESAKIQVGLSVPTDPATVDNCYTDVVSWVTGKLQEERKKLGK
jgi:hypothetical protein